jgi:D-alanyl-D-alanine carboxypeptidase
MSRTTFANASGLPNPRQVTTARDLTILGRSVQERFPKQYDYFALPGFQFSGSTIRNHNKLLGRIEGVDGIKTGYTRASGFNLLTSAKRDNRRIVAVVLGGRSGGHRDNIMAGLVEDHIDRGARGRSAPMIAENNAPSSASLERAIETAEARAPVAAPAPVPAPVARAPEAAPARAVEQAPRENMLPSMQLAAYAPDERARPAVISGSARDDGSTTASIRSSTPSSSNGATPTMRWVSGPRGIVSGQPASLPQASGGGLFPPAPIPAAEPTRIASSAPNTLSLPTQQSVQSREPDNSAQRPAFAKTGVMIQVGATDDLEKANALLARARVQGKGALASARPFTEKVSKGSETMWRARFAGLDEARAEAACKTLKRSGIACFTTRN